MILQSGLCSGLQKQQLIAGQKRKWNDIFPTEISEKIFHYVDPKTLIQDCTRVCHCWKCVINRAPWEKLPKWVYKEIIISEQHGFEIKLIKDVHSNNRPKKRSEIGSKKPRKLAKSIRKEHPQMKRIPKYLRHVTCDKLTFQSLSGTNFSYMLHDISYLCLDSKVLVFDFCNFVTIQRDLQR